ncbi:hypothetical protein B0H34DRAFT_691404 [Crassisporium funariophilum]|nr:hypothetical protein B0H34DRAFT_691404 [Crassisporium funariophilum]
MLTDAVNTTHSSSHVEQTSLKDIDDASRSSSWIVQQNAHTPSPNLLPELLLEIFLINANMDNDDPNFPKVSFAQITTRHCSSVCRFWREVALGSSSLWGRLLHVRQGNQEWRQTMLHRSGASPLCVQGRVNGSDAGCTAFISAVLANEWPRIRVFRVIFRLAALFPTHIWECIRRPAPLLESFEVDIDPHISTAATAGGTQPRFFDDHAPNLRKLIVKRMTVSINASCFSNIQEFSVTYGINRLSLTELLEILAKLPILESLSLRKAFLSPTPALSSSRYPYITLPRLRKLTLHQDFRGCAALLDHIFPEEGCSLELTTPLERGAITDLPTMQNAVSRYSRGWFQKTTCPELGLSLMRTSLRVWNIPAGDLAPSFDVDLHCSEDTGPIAPVLTLMKAFSECRFDRIDSLIFTVHYFPDSESVVSLQAFLALLPAVEVLVTDITGVHALLPAKAPTQSSPDDLPCHLLLPVLRTLKIRRLSPNRDEFVLGVLLSFLGMRADAQAPLQSLELVMCPFLQEKLTKLDQFVGLNVRWQAGGNIHQYVCGSGGDICKISLTERQPKAGNTSD